MLMLALTLILGIFIGYSIASIPPARLIKPTVENAGKITYIDKFGVCYRYRAVPLKMSQENRDETPENIRDQLGEV